MIDITIKTPEEYSITFQYIALFLTQTLLNVHDCIVQFENDTYYERHRTKKEKRGKKEVVIHYQIPLTISEINNKLRESRLIAILEIAFNLTLQLKETSIKYDDVIEYLKKYSEYDFINKHAFENCIFDKNKLTESITCIINSINECKKFSIGDLENTNRVTAYVLNECNKLLEHLLFNE